MDALHEIAKSFADQVNDLEEKKIREVLSNHLGRPIVTQDARRGNIMFSEGNPESFLLQFDGRSLGFIQRRIDYRSLTCQIDFKPL